mmetsp:Transcript_2645/g.2871  ORF Transcript_2645/g.2871 Transcript_2645/m.2871 type:complete len:88 (-) Transcript_2645:130-393(-)
MKHPLATALFGSSQKIMPAHMQDPGTIAGSVRSVRSTNVSAARATFIAMSSTLSFGNEVSTAGASTALAAVLLMSDHGPTVVLDPAW